MSQEAKINLINHLKTKNEKELTEYSEIALTAGSQILYEAIKEVKPQIFEKKSFNKALFFDICKYGTAYSFETYIKNEPSNKIYDENNNSCLHYAAKYGNLKVLYINCFSKIIPFKS